MPYFDSSGVQIHYEEQGAGPAAILVHGFASNLKGNWKEPGWIDLLAANYRTIALDCRGHGLSAKPHEAQAYGSETMGGDVIRLMDHLAIERALLMGYSMGARLSLGLLASHPERFRAVVLGGIGATGRMTEPGRQRAIVSALLADSSEGITEEVSKTFRTFAERNRNDLKALAACMGAARIPVNLALLRANRVPVLIVVGAQDALVGDAAPLRDAIAGAELLTLSGRDHMSAVGDRRHKDAVLAFFKKAPA